MEQTILVKHKQAYDTEENWKANNPILLAGQVGYASDKYGMYKIGDGVHSWNELEYCDKKIYTGTQAEVEAAINTGEIEPGTIVIITDDYQEGGGNTIATTEKAGVVKPDGKTIKVSEDGEIVCTASGFTGTMKEFEAASLDGKIEVGTIVNITDDYQEVSSGNVVIDDMLSSTSKNPVQNKVITDFLKESILYLGYFNIYESKLDTIAQDLHVVDNKPYILSIHPKNITEGDYLQDGRSHIVLGLEYGNYAYGIQYSLGSLGIKRRYRIYENNTWSEWKNISDVGNIWTDLAADNIVCKNTLVYPNNNPNVYTLVDKYPFTENGYKTVVPSYPIENFWGMSINVGVNNPYTILETKIDFALMDVSTHYSFDEGKVIVGYNSQYGQKVFQINGTSGYFVSIYGLCPKTAIPR